MPGNLTLGELKQLIRERNERIDKNVDFSLQLDNQIDLDQNIVIGDLALALKQGYPITNEIVTDLAQETRKSERLVLLYFTLYKNEPITTDF